MATTTPKPTEGSPSGEHADGQEAETTGKQDAPARTAITQEGPTTATVTPPPSPHQFPSEHEVMDREVELARLAEIASRSAAAPWTLGRVLKVIFYFLLMTVLTFVFLVLMQGVAHTNDSDAVAMTASLEKWIELGTAERRGRRASGEQPEMKEVPAEASTSRPEMKMEPASEAAPVTRSNPEPEPTPKSLGIVRDMKSLKKPDPATEARIERVARSLPPLKLKGIGAVEDDALPWMQTMDLALSLEIEFKDKLPRVDARVLRSRLYHELIDLSVRVGHTDNPFENLEAIRGFLATKLAMTPVRRDIYPLEMTRPGTVLDSRRGSPRGIAILGLILADRINPYLELEPVTVGGVLGLRYRSGDHRYTLVPEDLSRLYGDRELIEYALGKDALGDVRVLSRRQFWGSVFTEVGVSLLTDGEIPRGTNFIERGLGLDHEYPLGHVARARVLLRNNEIQSAREELDLAVRLDPTSATARLSRFKLLGQHGDTATIENDLVWLTRNGSEPESGLWLAEHLLSQGRYEDAMGQVERVEARPHLSPALSKRVESLHERILAAPWVAILGDPERTPRMRFEALDRLREYPLPEVLETLAVTLGDENQRLARLSWKLLEELTNWELPFDSANWLEALERRSRLSPVSSH